MRTEYRSNSATGNAFQLNGSVGKVKQKEGYVSYTDNKAEDSGKQINGDAEASIGLKAVESTNKEPQRNS